MADNSMQDSSPSHYDNSDRKQYCAQRPNLPAELQNHIYGYVLASDSIKIVTPKATKQSGHFHVDRDTNVAPGLMRVSQQIRAEAISLPCDIDTVRFTRIGLFQQNAAALGAKQRAAVNRILVDIDPAFNLRNTIICFATRIKKRNMDKPLILLFPNIEAVDLCQPDFTRDLPYRSSDVKCQRVRWFSNYEDGTLRVEPGCGWRDILFTING